jgi:hypothetical protein
LLIADEDVAREVAGLVDAWCERRCLRALREILGAWPLASGMSDDWGRLDEALKGVRTFAGNELTDWEKETLERAIAQLDDRLFGRHS